MILGNEGPAEYLFGDRDHPLRKGDEPRISRLLDLFEFDEHLQHERQHLLEVVALKINTETEQK